MQFNPGPMYVPPSVVSRAADTSCSHGRIVMLPGDAWSDEVKVFKTDADYQQAIAEAEAELAAAIAAAEESIAALREAAK
jgi:cell wall assembly regulator SMI1